MLPQFPEPPQLIAIYILGFSLQGINFERPNLHNPG